VNLPELNKDWVDYSVAKDTYWKTDKNEERNEKKEGVSKMRLNAC